MFHPGADDELAAIRARRAAQLQQGGGMQGAMGGMQGAMQNQQNKAAQEEKQRAAEDQRAQILKAILEPPARERCTFRFRLFLLAGQ